MNSLDQITAYTQDHWWLYVLVILCMQIVAWIVAFTGGQWVKTQDMTHRRVRMWANLIGVAVVAWIGTSILNLSTIDIAGWAAVNVILYQSMVESAFRMSAAKKDKSDRWMFLYFWLRPHRDRRSGERTGPEDRADDLTRRF